MNEYIFLFVSQHHSHHVLQLWFLIQLLLLKQPLNLWSIPLLAPYSKMWTSSQTLKNSTSTLSCRLAPAAALIKGERPPAVSWHVDNSKDCLRSKRKTLKIKSETLLMCFLRAVCLSQWPECPVVQPHAADACFQLDQRSSGGIPRDFSSKAGSLRWIQVGPNAPRVIRSWLRTCKRITFCCWLDFHHQSSAKFGFDPTYFAIHRTLITAVACLITATDVWDYFSSRLRPAKAKHQYK